MADENEEPEEMDNTVPGQPDPDEMYDEADEEGDDLDEQYVSRQYVFELCDPNPWNIYNKVTDIFGINKKMISDRRKKYFFENLEYVRHSEGRLSRDPFRV